MTTSKKAVYNDVCYHFCFPLSWFLMHTFAHTPLQAAEIAQVSWQSPLSLQLSGKLVRPTV